MKRICILLLCVTLLLVCSCSSTSRESEDAFANGQKDAVDKIKYSAKTTDEHYLNASELYDYLKSNYGEEIAERVVYFSDIEYYTTEKIVNDIVDEYIWEFEYIT